MTNQQREAKYPRGSGKAPYKKRASRSKPKDRSKANLGKMLEGYLDASNETYNQRGRAVIFRQNPEVTVIRSGPKIVSAYHKKKAGLDFIGLTHGRSFTFDAKETREATRFPLDNIEGHQVLSMKRFTDQGGLAFLLIYFVKHQASFIVTYEQLAPFWADYTGDGRKSIPFHWFGLEAQPVGAGAGLAIDYLPELERMFSERRTKRAENGKIEP